MRFEDISVQVCGGELCLQGRLYGARSGDGRKRVLAWPGWLDNCGSFATLAPFFAKQGYTFVAMDPPGCGISDHLPSPCWYNDYEECLLQVQVAQELGWEEPFTLLAHSRGSNISTVTAGAFPERIRALIMLESYLGPRGCFAGNYPEIGALYQTFPAAIDNDRRNRLRKRKTLACLDQVIEESVQNKVFPKNKRTATEISKRHIVPAEGDTVTSTWDLRLYNQGKGFPLLYLCFFVNGLNGDFHGILTVQTNSVSPYVALKFAEAIQCPVLVINSRKGSLYYVTVDEFENWYKSMIRRIGISKGESQIHALHQCCYTTCAKLFE